MRSRSASGTPGPRSQTRTSARPADCAPARRCTSRAAVAARVLEQVAQRAAQQALVAVHAGWPRPSTVGLDARGLLGRQRRAGRPGRGGPASAAASSRLASSTSSTSASSSATLVSISRLSRSRCAGRRLVEHRHRHLHARQRRAQFVAGVGQQRLVRAHQRLDARGRVVEARRHGGHLVAPADLDAVVELAGAEALDALLQRLEPARQAAHHRVGAGGDGEEQHHQQHRQADAARPAVGGRKGSSIVAAGRRRPRGPPRRARRARRAGGGSRRPGRTIHSVRPSSSRTETLRAPLPRPARRSEGLGGDDARALRVVQRERQAQALRPVAQRRGLLVRRRIGARQRALDQVGPGRHALADQRSRRARAPARGGAGTASPTPPRTAAAPPPR